MTRNLLDPRQVKRWQSDDERIVRLRNKMDSHLEDQITPPLYDTYIISDEDRGIVCFSGDWHIGHESIDIKKLEYDLALIKANNIMTVLMGDLFDNYNVRSTDKKISTSVKLANQKDLVWNYLKTIKENIVGLLMGNHEHRSVQTDDFNVVNWLARELQINDLGLMNKIHINTPSREDPITIFVAHHWSGSSWHNRTYASAKARRDYPKIVGACDVTAFAHTHEAAIYTKANTIDIRIGSYVKYDDYSQRLNFFPSPCFMPAIYYDEFRILPFIDVQYAVNHWHTNKGK